MADTTGKITYYDPSRGVGRINFGSSHPEALFVITSVVNPSAQQLVVGQAVSFDWTMGAKGPVAESVTLL